MQISNTNAIRSGMVKRQGDILNHKDYAGKSSIEVSVGTVIYQDSEDKKRIKLEDETYCLEPQETVYVVSEETIHVPPGYVAYVFLKNQFSQQGLLAFNTGIIDGGFNGPISTLVTNLSSKKIELGEGKTVEFFRIVFHEIDMSDIEKSKVKIRDHCDIKEYQIYRKEELSDIPKYFLDPEKLKKKIDDSLNDKAQIIGVRKLTALLGVLSVFVVVLPIISEPVYDVFFNTEKISILEKRIEQLEGERQKNLNNLDRVEKKPSNNEK